MAMAASAYALSETSSHASAGDEPLEAAAFSASASAAAASASRRDAKIDAAGF